MTSPSLTEALEARVKALEDQRAKDDRRLTILENALGTLVGFIIGAGEVFQSQLPEKSENQKKWDSFMDAAYHASMLSKRS